MTCSQHRGRILILQSRFLCVLLLILSQQNFSRLLENFSSPTEIPETNFHDIFFFSCYFLDTMQQEGTPYFRTCWLQPNDIRTRKFQFYNVNGTKQSPSPVMNEKQTETKLYHKQLHAFCMLRVYCRQSSPLGVNRVAGGG